MPKINEPIEIVCPKCGDTRTLKFRNRGTELPCRSCALGGNNRKHGGEGTRLYRIWTGMRKRCRDKRDLDYGGRGISVCQEWNENFIPFRAWATKNGYADDLQIDRIDNDGNYEPSNCRWVTCKANQRNRRSSKYNTRKIQAIKVLSDNGWGSTQIATLLNEKDAYIASIVRREVWSDVEPVYMSMVSGC